MAERPSDSEHLANVTRRRVERMAAIDALTPGQRECVHEYGFNVVRAFMDIGIEKPKHIRHLVETVLNEFSPTRGCFSNQGVRVSAQSWQADAKDESAT
jgi:hypothetical protein